MLLSLPAMIFAQDDARKLLDKAVAALKADAGVRMDFKFAMYDLCNSSIGLIPFSIDT